MGDLLQTVRTIRDPIHEEVGLTALENRIMDTPMFQRMKWISQLSGVKQVYPSGVHNRFAHSLGVMHIAGMYGEKLFRGREDDERDIQLMRLAAMLHDIGHGPYSHQFDDTVYQTVYPGARHGHDHHRNRIITETEMGDMIRENFDPKEVMKVWDGGLPIHHAVVQGVAGADRMDFMLRDSFFCGTSHFGILPLTRIINNSLIYPHDGVEALHYNWKVLDDIFAYLIGRFFEYKRVYFHQKSRAADIIIQRMLRAACGPLNLTERTKDMDQFTYLNEYTLFGEIFASTSEEMEPARKAARRMLDRDLPKSVWEKMYDEKTAQTLGLSSEDTCQFVAQKTFIEPVMEALKKKGIEIPELILDPTYRLSTISQQEFHASQVYLWDPKNHLLAPSESVTMEDALKQSNYFNVGASKGMSDAFIVLRVYAEPEFAPLVRKTWQELNQTTRHSAKDRDVSLTSY